MTRLSWLGLVLALAVPAGPLAPQSVAYEGAASFARGDYVFTETTSSYTISSGLAFTFGHVTFRASLPVYVQNSTLISGTATGLLPTGGGGDATRALRDSSMARKGRDGMQGGPGASTQGNASFASPALSGEPVEVPSTVVTDYQTRVGDPTVQVALFPVRGRTAFGITASAKVPLTDTTDFGTGEWDVGGSVSLSQQIGAGGTFVGVDLGYWILGDLPDLELRDPWLVGASVSFVRPSGWGGSLSVSGAQSVVEGFENAYSIGAGLIRVGSRGSIGANVSFGLTETTPTVSAGIIWRLTLLGR